MCKRPKENNGNVVKGPWKTKSKKQVVIPDVDVIEMQENLIFCENGFDVHQEEFSKDMGFIIESVRSTLYRQVGYEHPMSKIMSAFTKSNIDPKGEVGDGFDLPGLDDVKIKKLIEDLDEDEEDPNSPA